MNLAEIETFLMIVKTKNITKTAENLFLSQPTVSHRLKSLEEELDVKLIARKKGYKQIEITTQGEAFIPIAERWVSVWREMQYLKHSQETLYLTVGCTDTMNSVLMELYHQMLGEKEQNINLHIKTHYSYELYDLLENHEIDIGFVYHHLQFKNIVTEAIMREKSYILRSARAGEPREAIHTDELDPQKEIFVSWEANYQIWHDQTISKGEWPRIQVDTFELLLHLLADDTLWAIVPISVAERIATLRPVQISENDNATQPPERITYKIKHKYPNEATLKAVQVFEEKINAYLRTKDWGYVGQ